jgi:hypothetical protein
VRGRWQSRATGACAPAAELKSLGVDSLSLTEIVFEFEDLLGIKIDGAAARCTTLGDVVEHVDRLLLEQHHSLQATAPTGAR